MSGPAIDSLFAAAREDAPDDATHDEMWSRIANATGIAASAAAVTVAAKPAAAATATAKLLVLAGLIGAIGAAVGGVVTLGWMERETGIAPHAVTSTAPVARATHVPAHGARLADARPRARDPHVVDRVVDRPAAIATSSAPASDLAEEARIVTDARRALVAGEPMRALSLLAQTHRFTTRALEPEELSLEARALRALGRVDEAAAKELTLRSRFPSHALSR